ncbi:MAG: DUF1571 domain-containing protein [Phycisphaerales bacterium]|nr:MAG: DUF1571 domain-containing protein [Phycisphaerales bacterium]
MHKRIVPSPRTALGLCVLASAALRCHDAPRGSTLISQLAEGPQQASAMDVDHGASLHALAVKDPLGFLRMCRAHYDATVTDYTCTFFKQERIGGVLGPEQEIEVFFRESPYSVAMRWVRNPGRAQQATYVEGRWRDEKANAQLLIRPSGVLGAIFPEVRRNIHGPSATQESRRTIDQFGYRNSLDLIIRYCEKALADGDLAYSLECAGEGEVAGRPTFAFRRRLPYAGERGEYPDALLVIHIDQERLVPTACVAYADADGQELLGSYLLVRAEFNVGLDDDDFTMAPASH